MILNLPHFRTTLVLLVLAMSFNTFSQVTIDNSNFTSGWDSWNDLTGNDDCVRGSYGRPNGATDSSIRFRDDSGDSSAMESNIFDLTPYSSVDFTFEFEAVSMETNEDFFIMFSNDGGVNWTIVETFVRTTGTPTLPEFNNGNNGYNPTVSILNAGATIFTSNSLFRVECSASGNGDYIYIDNVLIEGYLASGPEINITGLGNTIIDGQTTILVSDDTDFGSVVTSSGSVIHTFTIENNGTTDLTLSNPVISAGNAGDFTLSTVSSPVTASGSTTFTVTFDPTVDGTRTATISIINNDSDENTYTFDVEGVGYTPAPEINITGLSNSIVDGDTTPTTTDDTDFGSADITIGSVVHTFTIENNGTLGLNLTGSSPYVSISGAHPGDFSVTTTPSSTITAGNSTTFQIAFDPTAVGLRTAIVSISNDDSDENPYNFDIQGTGTTATYTNVNVSVTWPNWSSENTVEVYSPSGTLITTIDDGGLSGDSSYSGTFNLGCLEDLSNYYFIMYDSYGDGWNGTDNITITVGGTAIINQSDSNNASPGGYTTFFNVSGGSSAAEISVTSNTIEIVDGDTTPATNDNTDFGKVQFGVETKVNNFLIENQSCSATLNLTGGSPYIVISGAAAADFSVTATPTTPILAGGNTIFAITFNPTTAGIKTATLTIANDDSDEPSYNFDITGESIAPLTAGPGGVKTELKLWLKSTAGLGYADGVSVSTWGDQGLGTDATVNTAGQEPTFKDNITDNINFNPVIDFDNNYATIPLDGDYSFDDTGTQFLEGTGGFYTEDIFIVLIPDTTADNSFGSMDIFCGDEDEATNATDATGIGFGAYSVRFTDEVISYAVGTTSSGDGYGVAETSISKSYSNAGIINVRNNAGATQQELFYNANDIEGTQNDIPDFSNVDDSRYWIGRSEGWEASMDARIAEIINYSSRQSDIDLTDNRNRIMSYLAIKYGITLGVNGTSQDYVDSDGTVIWDQSVNSGYNFDIGGIGRNDDADLNQKQSSSVNNATDGTGLIEGIITVGLTDIYDTNGENITTNAANTFGDKEFLVWGNDGTDLNLAAITVNVNMSAGITPALTTNVTFTAMQRIWKFVETGGDVSTVKVSIPQDAVRNITPPGSFLMFISETGIFDPTADYRVMTSDGNGNLEADYDFDGTKYITFGYAPEVIVERSIYFDGAVDYVDMEDALDLNTSFTISAWIKRGAGSTDTSILSKRDNAYTEGYDYKITNTGRFEMSWKNGSTQTITSDVVIPQDEWHQVAIIYSGGIANLFIDGVLDKTATLTAPTNTTQSFYIAAAGKSAPIAYFEGNIDEVRVWDTALSVDQLRYVMNQEITENTTFTDGVFVPTSITKNDVSTIPWTNLAGYYPMSVYTYTNTNDESGNNNQGALRNLNTVDYQTAPLPYKSDANGDWDTNATWLNGSEQTIPGATSIVDSNTTVDWNIVEMSHNITIDNTLSLPSGKNDNRFLLALIVNSNELTLEGDNVTDTGNGLTITHYLELDGVLDLEGESQLIQTDGSDLALSSTGSIERDQQGTENSFTYNYWSAPVSLIGAGTNNSSFTIANILKDGTDPANPLTPNFAYNYTHADGTLSTPRKIATYWIWNFVNLSNAYANWNWIGDSNYLNVTEGYTMKGTSNTGVLSDNQNYVFIGKPNNVLNGATELVHTTFGVPADPSNPEVSLTGNPFPSAIDANQFITDNLTSTDGQILFWEHWGGGNHNLGNYQGGYATRTIATGVPATSHPSISQTGTGSKTPGQYISVAQGFFVTSSAVGGDVVFKNSQRVFEKEGTASSVFFRESSAKNTRNTVERNELDKMIIRLGFESPSGFHRQVAAAFNIDGATDAIEKGYDGHASNILSNDAFFIQDDKYYVIQAYGDFNEEREIPLVIIIDEDNNGGLQKIMIDGLENISESTEIYIKDNVSGETHEINTQTYEVNLNSGIYYDRFTLVFRSQTLSVNDEESLENKITVYMDNSSSTIQIRKVSETNINKVTLYNYLGQAIQIWANNLSKSQISLPVNEISTGVYILEIEENNKITSKKLIIE